MSWASSSSLKGRSIPLVTATALSISIYAVHTYSRPIHSDSSSSSTPITLSPPKKPKFPISGGSPYTPLGWGSNRCLTLVPDSSISSFKRPTPLPQLGSTPLRDLILAEKYGVAVDANGDCWLWGTGYDDSGENIKSVVTGSSKLFCLSENGRLYALSSSRSTQQIRIDRKEQSWWSYLFSRNAGVDHVELSAEGGMKRGEKWASVSTGQHHLLALTTKGRTFSLPLSPSANSHRQLGLRELSTSLSSGRSGSIPPEADPRFACTLKEIPSLVGIEIAQVASGDKTSFVRTPSGRVLGFGANEVGQIGLGANTSIDIVPTPVEIVLARNYPGGTSMTCLDVKAGGSTTLFTVERDSPGKPGKFIDLLACGSGISGALGNGLWSSASPAPVKVKTISGLQEYSEKENAFIPLGIHNISISPSSSSHIFAVLDTATQADVKGLKQGLYGKDVMVWGGNADYQLGNGKRSSLSVPQHLPVLISRGGESDSEVVVESELSSGTLSPMPHSRLQLHRSQADAYDLQGKLIKRNVKCEETMVAGYNASVLYNKIIE